MADTGDRRNVTAMTARNRQYAALFRTVTLVLGTGVALALVLLAAGLVMNAFSIGAAAALMTSGIMALLATPALAVLVTAVFSIRLGDRWTLAASLVILAVLAASLLLAPGAG